MNHKWTILHLWSTKPANSMCSHRRLSRTPQRRFQFQVKKTQTVPSRFNEHHHCWQVLALRLKSFVKTEGQRAHPCSLALTVLGQTVVVRVRDELCLCISGKNPITGTRSVFLSLGRNASHCKWVSEGESTALRGYVFVYVQAHARVCVCVCVCAFIFIHMNTCVPVSPRFYNFELHDWGPRVTWNLFPVQISSQKEQNLLKLKGNFKNTKSNPFCRYPDEETGFKS